MPVPSETPDKRLPVTLLSGFLGSGKTTLLSYILRSKDHGLRCAVIVNDMGALNIDASLISHHKLTQKEEKLIQMQNGCICCTLRADLLEEVANLAEVGDFDYLIIESSGISEPIQVAETFTQEFAESIEDANDESLISAIADSLPLDSKSISISQTSTSPESRKRLAKLIAQGGLSRIARLDTCVSMVDCTTFLSDFDTTDFLTDRHGAEVTPEDERNITDLLTDQIEFANVILLNKTDIVSVEQLGRIENLVRTLNPGAKIIRTVYSKVDLKELLNTRSFDFEKAATGAGWLQSLKESSQVPFTDTDGVTRMVPKPETLEYGIGSFVYQARRPFHPKRLWELVTKPFAILQTTFEDSDSESSENEDGEEEEQKKIAVADPEKEKKDTFDRLQAEKAELDLPGRAEFKRNSIIWKGLLRSKGFIWLASRPDVHGEWSQAGLMFTLSGGSRWFCTTPEEHWPLADMEGAADAIKLDFYGKWGDRRQELVFIGQGLDQTLLTETLNEVLLTDSEWSQWEKIMTSKRKTEEQKRQKLFELFEDGWEDWLDPDGDEEVEADVDHQPLTASDVETSSVRSGLREEKGTKVERREATTKLQRHHDHDHSHHDRSSANKKRKIAAMESKALAV